MHLCSCCVILCYAAWTAACLFCSLSVSMFHLSWLLMAAVHASALIRGLWTCRLIAEEAEQVITFESLIARTKKKKESEKEKQQQGGGITCSLQPSPEKTIRTLWWWALILFLSIMSNQKNRCVYFEKIPPVSVRHISPAADSPASMKWWRITKYGLMI